ncbi:LysM peptidoglycan-binding domain-containing protein [Spartinivicinus poritis]|uniref:LysM peptidoglycan-binding domain-containing protein n=1 Tax=Spartinivicinus poritis TaxID=2994640 RepID=A0ABT5UGD3_9GAMM|nr:LysM peptidoglycan-binding domain-containing protein [Spartinivicinus sp. A2-2]MDE1465442.1 LysM peptidoglycan-binding domain-containing protein [Spartinivicinus sp. A2-2]
MLTHTVVAGDTLGRIAKQYYGDAMRYPEIAKANQLEDINRLEIGQQLVIPNIEQTQPVKQQAATSEVDTEETGSLISLSQLQQILPRTKEETLSHYFSAINRCLHKYQINTSLRIAHFIAQIAHESGGLRYVSENLNYSKEALIQVFGKYFPNDNLASQYARNPEKIANRVYANRMGNGNESSGDGWRYRGRGFIQLTGKTNYQSYKKDSGVDVVSMPDEVAQNPTVVVDAAGWYWNKNSLNRYADQDDIRTITRRINGGLNGLDDRQHYLTQAKQVLGC